MLEIIHHGGATGVTGSCHQLLLNRHESLLVDCGLFQGEDAAEDSFEQLQIEFDISTVKALIITHVHIDHVGRLPYLLAAGFTGPIICSIPTAKLLPLVIEDALKIGFTRNAQLIERFQAQLEKQIVSVPYGKWHSISDVSDHNGASAGTTRVKLKRAGHILGSSYVEVSYQDAKTGEKERIVFSGDLGAPYAPLLPAPKSPYGCDQLVLESTYGNRQHPDRRQRRATLKAAVEQALANGGTVMVPAFSIGRTQELLYELETIIHQARSSRWQSLEIIVDSPLADRFTKVYRELKPYWDKEAQGRLRSGRHPLNFANLYTVDSHAEHEQTVEYLAKTGRPAIVIAASGMCAGGRIMNYLKAMLGDERHQVLFVGYQGTGTPGRDIQQYGPQGGWVAIDGERFDIKAGVTTISGYSAHADQKDLLNFVKRMRRWPHTIHLVHGEQTARAALKSKLEVLYLTKGKQVNVLSSS
ncbi:MULTISPECIES: MBL fold metallo-hydrolase [unclassified Halomonas]|uniref:MBL fold metallo-hydrolase RNA specificity domain-containing protein n=1 Tax=unclassified Halomonas TaxID=2609666 RepID=UPI0007D92721|nr:MULTISPECIES: MBL fold metallo-hydrolase [unclassified Halomonas]MBT2787306.1 MBL fold metallo-hydrolase [Halomonas sp. ISL-106]MBT2796330.1 MBL fold metallo-hydrolase [Halomonas sp. ISL-104]OAL57520.1 MBL fold hydrolase [Halomonas sp. ALS9]